MEYSREKFEDDVSVITDRVWSQLNRQHMAGNTAPIEVLGIKVHGGMTRDHARAAIHKAAFRSAYDEIEAAK